MLRLPVPSKRASSSTTQNAIDLAPRNVRLSGLRPIHSDKIRPFQGKGDERGKRSVRRTEGTQVGHHLVIIGFDRTYHRCLCLARKVCYTIDGKASVKLHTGYSMKGFPRGRLLSRRSVTCVALFLCPQAPAKRCRRRGRSKHIPLLASEKSISLQVRALLVASHGMGGEGAVIPRP